MVLNRWWVCSSWVLLFSGKWQWHNLRMGRSANRLLWQAKCKNRDPRNLHLGIYYLLVSSSFLRFSEYLPVISGFIAIHIQIHCHFSNCFWVLASGPPTVSCEPPLPNFPLAQTSSYHWKLVYHKASLFQFYSWRKWWYWQGSRYGSNCLFKTVVLNRVYTYPLGVRSTKTGGKKHQIFYGMHTLKILNQEYTPRNLTMWCRLLWVQ